MTYTTATPNTAKQELDQVKDRLSKAQWRAASAKLTVIELRAVRTLTRVQYLRPLRPTTLFLAGVTVAAAIVFIYACVTGNNPAGFTSVIVGCVTGLVTLAVGGYAAEAKQRWDTAPERIAEATREYQRHSKTTAEERTRLEWHTRWAELVDETTPEQMAAEGIAVPAGRPDAAPTNIREGATV